MKKITKIVAVFLCLIMAFSVVACSKTKNSNDSKTGNNSNNDTASQSERKFYKISMYSTLHASSSLEDIPEEGFYLDRLYEEKFNVKFDFRYVPSANSEEVFNITMASNDIPDIMTGNWNNLHKYADAFWDLNDFIIGKYKNLEKYFFDDPYVYALSAEPNGQIKILNMLSEQFLGDTLLVRGDLIEKWGIDLSKVKTKEDWYEVFKLVKEKNPNMVPYMTRKKTEGVIQRLCEGWSGIKQYVFVDEKDNTVKYGAADPRMKEVVTWLRKLYQEGLIDQEYPTTDTTKWQEKLLNDGIFLTHDNAPSRITWAATEWANLGVTDKYLIAVPPIQPDANTPGYTTIHYPKLRGGLAIYVGAEKGKVDRILEMCDYNFSEEGNILVNYGIENVSFYYGEDGLIYDVPEYRQAVDNKTMPQKDQIKGTFTSTIRLEPNGVYTPQYRRYQAVLDAAKMYEDGGLIKRNWVEVIRFSNDEQKEINELNANIKTYTDENLDKFIMGVKSMDEWDAFVEGYKQFKLDRYLEIYNAAYKRAMDAIGSYVK